MCKLDQETKSEIIKALAEGMPIMNIANYADVSEKDIQRFAEENKAAIEERRKASEEFGL